MVHALNLGRGLLKPGGLLVNVNNLPVPAAIEVHTDQGRITAGWILDKTEFESERSAFGALAEVVSQGSFTLKDERDFIFHIHSVDFGELRIYLSEWWESAVLPEKTSRRVEKIIKECAYVSDIVLKVPTRMSALKSI